MITRARSSNSSYQLWGAAAHRGMSAESEVDKKISAAAQRQKKVLILKWHPFLYL
jgi:hypothetical protein